MNRLKLAARTTTVVSVRVKRMVHIVLAAMLAAAALAWVVPAHAAPSFPSSFYGAVVLANGSPAPAGLQVVASIRGVTFGQTAAFSFQGATVYRLDVRGDDPDTSVKDGGVEGDPVVIAVGEPSTGQTFLSGIWRAGGNTRLDLPWAPGSPPTSEPSAPPQPPPAASMQVRMTGMLVTGSTDSSGVALDTLEAITGKVKVVIPKGSRLSMGDGSAVRDIAVQPVATLPPLPATLVSLGRALDFSPDGTNIVPPAALTLGYSLDEVPAGVAESQLRIAYWNGSSWEVQASTVDTVARTVTIALSHFSTYALMAVVPAPPAQPAATATPIPMPTPTPVPATPTPTPLPTATLTPQPTATSAPVPPPPPPTATPTPTPTPASLSLPTATPEPVREEPTPTPTLEPTPAPLPEPTPTATLSPLTQPGQGTSSMAIVVMVALAAAGALALPVIRVVRRRKKRA